MRALEVSLGLPHIAPGSPQRHQLRDVERYWPVELFTQCPHTLMQGWVSWSQYGPGETEGVTRVVFALPPNGHAYYDTLVPPVHRRTPNYALDPPKAPPRRTPAAPARRRSASSPSPES
jgi:hypothetical protein